jgi:hypothetical protein
MKIPANRKGLPTIGSLQNKLQTLETEATTTFVNKAYKHDSTWATQTNLLAKIESKEVLTVEIIKGEYWYEDAEGVSIDVVDFNDTDYACALNEMPEIRMIKKEHAKIV